jgi:hypothetical protein
VIVPPVDRLSVKRASRPADIRHRSAGQCLCRSYGCRRARSVGYVADLQKAGADGVIGCIANVPNAAMIFNAIKTLKGYPAQKYCRWTPSAHLPFKPGRL